MIDRAARYLTPYQLSKETRQNLLTREQPDVFLGLLDEIYKETISRK